MSQLVCAEYYQYATVEKVMEEGVLPHTAIGIHIQDNT